MSLSALLPLLFPLLLPPSQEDGPVAAPRWFEGTFEELLAEAAEAGTRIWLHMEADYSSPSQNMRRRVYVEPGVAALLSGYLCHRLDVGLPAARALGERFALRPLPRALVLEPDGQPVDCVEGYLQPDELAAELERIARGEDTIPAMRAELVEKPKDLELILRLAVRLRTVGDRKGWESGVARLRELDPEGRSRPSRRVRLDGLIERLGKGGQPEELEAFLKEETDPGLLFDGFKELGTRASRLADQADRRRDYPKAREQARLFVGAWRRAWKHCTPPDAMLYGDYLAKRIYGYRSYLEREDVLFGVEVIERCLQLMGRDVDLIDTWACCLHASGQTEKALRAIQLGRELDPGSFLWPAREKEFGK